MRHQNHRSRLRRPTGPRLALLRALSEALIMEERIMTTAAKAKVLRPIVERLVTQAKKGQVHNRRLAFAQLQKKEAVKKLFSVIGPRFQDRAGGYTRIVHAGQRQGDGAWMAYIEFIDFVPKPKQTKKAKTEGEAVPAAAVS